MVLQDIETIICSMCVVVNDISMASRPFYNYNYNTSRELLAPYSASYSDILFLVDDWIHHISLFSISMSFQHLSLVIITEAGCMSDWSEFVCTLVHENDSGFIGWGVNLPYAGNLKQSVHVLPLELIAQYIIHLIRDALLLRSGQRPCICFLLRNCKTSWYKPSLDNHSVYALT